jgi:alkylation response protein AidB-like acyl-CoA dehydrogenase
MDPAASDDQKLIMETSGRIMDQLCPLTEVRASAYRDAEFALAYRRRASELGWFSMLVPEELGGGNVSGNGVLDATLIAFERGRRLQPAPFVGTNVVAYALAQAGSPDHKAKVLPGLMSGDAAAAWLPLPTAPGQGFSATRTSSGYEFSGRSTHVQDADSAAWLLVTAEADNGVVQALIDPTSPGLTVTPLESLDVTRGFAEVELDGVDVAVAALVGEGDARDLVERQLAVACVLTTAELVGAMDHDFEMALQYAKDRIAFGRPIGSFQAIKHLLADTSLMLEMSKAIALAAASSVGTNDGYGLEAASMAKAFVGDCGIDLAQNCFQIFGGIGFTWEHDQHLYLRRVTTDSALFGGPAWHRERLCQLSGL